jgi:hypothetical protein
MISPSKHKVWVRFWSRVLTRMRRCFQSMSALHRVSQGKPRIADCPFSGNTVNTACSLRVPTCKSASLSRWSDRCVDPSARLISRAWPVVVVSLCRSTNAASMKFADAPLSTSRVAGCPLMVPFNLSSAMCSCSSLCASSTLCVSSTKSWTRSSLISRRAVESACEIRRSGP